MFQFQIIIVYIYFIIGSNSEHVGEESSRAHDNNGTYIHQYILCSLLYYNFIGGVAQTDNNTFDNQTDGKLLYLC